MNPRTRSWLVNGLKVVGGLLLTGAAVFAFFGVRLIVDGVYPPDGNGSLGHVGMVIAGSIGCFAALTSALLGIWAWGKSAKLSRSTPEQSIPPSA